MTSTEFADLLHTIADGWNTGDPASAADCFAENAIYQEPPERQLYHGRDALYAFFGGGQTPVPLLSMMWHHLIFDDAQQIGTGEYTFQGEKRYHGTVWVKVSGGKITNWREYQYVSELDWDTFAGDNRF